MHLNDARFFLARKAAANCALRAGRLKDGKSFPRVVKTLGKKRPHIRLDKQASPYKYATTFLALQARRKSFSISLYNVLLPLQYIISLSFFILPKSINRAADLKGSLLVAFFVAYAYIE